MAKGEYEFPTLVVCLLILGLQIHNPFQGQRQSSCCPCDGTRPDTSVGRPADATQMQQSWPGSQQPQQHQPAVSEPTPSVYRPPREAAPATPATPGLSTDALLRELDSIQAKAREQQDTLAAAGKMPPPSPLLVHLKETEAAEASAAGRGMAAGIGMAQPSPVARAPAVPSVSSMLPAVAPGGGNFGNSEIGRRADFGRYLEARQPRGLGVVLGVGRGDFALRLLADWGSAQGVYLVDPYIHIWRGYDDPANLADRDHQVVFEGLRNQLQAFEGRYVLVRDFSHSFAESYRRGGIAPGLPTFVYIDANHAEPAVTRDLELWWPMLASGGILAGSTYGDDADGSIRVRSVIDKWVSQMGLRLFLTHDDQPPSWFVFKA